MSGIEDYVKRLKAFTDQEKAAKRKARRIIVFFSGRDLGDFVIQNIVAAALTKPLEAYVLAVFKSHADYDFIAECNPYVHSEMKADPTSAVTIPVDWFDVGVYAPVQCPEPEWKERKFHKPDVILLPGMLRADASRLSGLAEAPPILRVPDERRGTLTEALCKRGLDEERWFACVDADNASLAVHITKKQGGQALVLDAMPLPEQAYALSRARYYVGGNSDATTLASAFGAPSAIVGTLDYANRVWNKNSVVAGEAISAVAAADHMLEATAACSGWRPDPEEVLAEPKDGVTFPFPMRAEPLLTFLA